MKLSKKIFELYFNSKIDEETLKFELNVYDKNFPYILLNSIYSAMLDKDSELIEYLVFIIFLCENDLTLSLYCDVLNELLLCTWHNQHENIVLLLQKIKSESSVDVLSKAIGLHLDYLSWDENRGFEVKCIWALGKIATENSLEKLKLLLHDDNKIIRENAQKQVNYLVKIKSQKSVKTKP